MTITPNAIEQQGIENKAVTQKTIPLNAQVYCRNEFCGKVVSTIINPFQMTLTHLVVRGTHRRPHAERLVSIRLVEACQAGKIQLSCSTTAFNRLPPFEKEEEIPFNILLDSVVMADDWLGPDVPMWPMIETKTSYRNLPPPSQELPFRTVIHAANGRVGVLSQLMINANSDTISHLVMQHGYLWNQKELHIPTEYIKSITDFAIRLTLNKRTVMTLPALPHISLKQVQDAHSFSSNGL